MSSLLLSELPSGILRSQAFDGLAYDLNRTTGAGAGGNSTFLLIIIELTTLTAQVFCIRRVVLSLRNEG